MQNAHDSEDGQPTEAEPRAAELERKREELASLLGASLYEATKGDSILRVGREELYDGIKAIDEELARLQAEAMPAQDAEFEPEPEPEPELEPAPVPEPEPEPAQDVPLTCAVCGAPMEETFLFCRACGAKKGSSASKPVNQADASLATPSQPWMTTVLQQPVSDTRVCVACGKPMDPEHRFCMSCGAKNDPAPTSPGGAMGTTPAYASPDHTTILSFNDALLCSVCGAALEPGNRFCAVCGSKV